MVNKRHSVPILPPILPPGRAATTTADPDDKERSRSVTRDTDDLAIPGLLNSNKNTKRPKSRKRCFTLAALLRYSVDDPEYIQADLESDLAEPNFHTEIRNMIVYVHSLQD